MGGRAGGGRGHRMITSCFLESSASAPELRVAVLLDGARVPRWALAVLEDIARSSFARVVLAVEQRPAAAPRRLGALAYAIYDRVDRAIAGDADPLALVDPGAWLWGVDRAPVPAAGEDGELRLPAEALAELGRRGIDVILRLCAAVPRGEVLGAARCGVWSFRDGADERSRGGAPFFQEIVGGDVTREVALEVVDGEPGGGRVLCRSTFAPQGGMSAARRRYAPIWETTHLVLRKLHELHERGWEQVLRHAPPRRPSATAARGASPPTTAEMARFLVPRAASAIARRLRPKTRERWRFAVRRTSAPLFAAPGPRDASDFRWIEAPRGRCWADPFLFEQGGATHVFFEDLEHDRGFAGISHAEVRSDGALGEPRRCLDPGFHLSFPLVFEHEGEVFMLPESLSNGTVTLYRARRFPDVWVQEKVLFRGNAVDTAVWRARGSFYFFATLCDRDDRGMTTVLFVADSLTGAWRMHPVNPVSSDVRRARGAGAIFRRGGRLFRPVQDCGPCYGHGVALEEIVALTEDRYEARPFCWVDRSRLAIPAGGVHTYNQAGPIEVIDGWIAEPGGR